MFGWFKPKFAPEGPVTFDFDIEIDCPCEAVFSAIDWSDERNLQAAMGHLVESDPGHANRFVMTIPGFDGHRFLIEVDENRSPYDYAFTSRIDPMIGRLASSRESYRIEPRGQNGCLLRLVTEATFDQMKLKHFPHEVAMMSVASHNALAKLKLYVEDGIEAVNAVKDEIIV